MKQEIENIYYPILSPANALLVSSAYSLELSLPGLKLLLLKIYTWLLFMRLLTVFIESINGSKNNEPTLWGKGVLRAISCSDTKPLSSSINL